MSKYQKPFFCDANRSLARTWRWIVLAVALFFVIQLLTFLSLRPYHLTMGQLVAYSGLLTAACMTAVCYTIAWRLVGQPKRLIGVWRWDGAELTHGLVALMVFWGVSELLGGVFEQSPMGFMDGLIDDYSFVPMLLFVVVIAPIYEEILFRGLVLGLLIKASRPKLFHRRCCVAMLISSVLFALVHLQYNWFGFLAIFALAMILAWLRIRTGSILLPIILHILNNLVAMMTYLWIT